MTLDNDRDALIERLAQAITGPEPWTTILERDRVDAMDAAHAVLALLESEGWGLVEAQDAVIARQAAALIALSQDPGGDLVSRRDIEARHGAVLAQLRAALARSQAEVERLRGLLGHACDAIDDYFGGASEVAANLRGQGDIRRG